MRAAAERQGVRQALMSLKLHLAVIALSMSLIVPLATAGPRPAQLKPVDEGPRRRDFLQFREALQRTVVGRDVKALLQVLHPEIKNSFGGGDGIEGFKERWELETPNTRVWRELGSVLALGGTFEEQDTFVAPYVTSRWPDELDPFD